MEIAPIHERDLRKDTILDAAKKLISRNGYKGLSIRDLARDSGMAKGTIYYHFEDKEQIYLNVLERDLINVCNLITDAAQRKGSVHERLHKLIETYSELIWLNRSLFVTRLREINEMNNSVQQLLYKHRPAIVEPIELLLQEGIDAGIFRPINIEFSVVSLFGMMNSFVTHRLMLGENSGANLEKTAQENRYNSVKERSFIKDPTQDLEDIQDKIVQHTFDLFIHAISIQDSPERKERGKRE